MIPIKVKVQYRETRKLEPKVEVYISLANHGELDSDRIFTPNNPKEPVRIPVGGTSTHIMKEFATGTAAIQYATKIELMIREQYSIWWNIHNHLYVPSNRIITIKVEETEK